MVKKFTMEKNDFLRESITGYFHQYYTKYKNPGNPDFLNILKNTFNSEQHKSLCEARDQVINILLKDIPEIMQKENLPKCMVTCVPRAKSQHNYTKFQLMFKEAVKLAIANIRGVLDGTDCITRIVNTRTTHIRKPISNNTGPTPYPGITKASCEIDKTRIERQNIILVDDIYTKTVNVDEDCIQALLDNGANKVVFYSIAFTKGGLYELFDYSIKGTSSERMWDF